MKLENENYANHIDDDSNRQRAIGQMCWWTISVIYVPSPRIRRTLHLTNFSNLSFGKQQSLPERWWPVIKADLRQKSKFMQFPTSTDIVAFYTNLLCPFQMQVVRQVRQSRHDSRSFSASWWRTNFVTFHILAKPPKPYRTSQSQSVENFRFQVPLHRFTQICIDLWHFRCTWIHLTKKYLHLEWTRIHFLFHWSTGVDTKWSFERLGVRLPAWNSCQVVDIQPYY